MQKTKATPPRERTFTTLPDGILSDTGVSDRTFRFILTIASLDVPVFLQYGLPLTDDDFAQYAAGLKCSPRTLEDNVREAVKAGYLTVKRDGKERTFLPGPVL